MALGELVLDSLDGRASMELEQSKENSGEKGLKRIRPYIRPVLGQILGWIVRRKMESFVLVHCLESGGQSG